MAVKASATVTLSSVVDVKSVWRYYKLQVSTLSKPSKPTTNPPSGWTTTEPSYTDGSTNSLYFCDLTVFCDDTFVYSDVSLSSSYEAAKAAYNKAVAAKDAADNAQDQLDNKGLREYIIDLLDTNTYATDTYYPVVGTSIPATGYHTFEVNNQLRLNTAPSWSTHTNKGFTCNLSARMIAYGWGIVSGKYGWIDNASYAWCDKMPAYISQMTNSSYPVFYLRGGGKYYVYTDYACTWSIKTDTYTSNNQSVAPKKTSSNWTGLVNNWDIVTRVTNAETSITNNQNEIKLKATKTEVTEAVNNIQVGGRNLLVGTSTHIAHTGTGSTNQTKFLYEVSNYYINMPSLVDKELTLSFEWETTATNGTFLIQLNDTPWTQMSETITVSSSNTSGKSVYTIRANSGFDTGNYWGILIRSDNLTGTVTVKNVMFEMGNKASSWQPAPEDMLSASDAAETYTTQTEFTQTSDEIRMDFNKSIASASSDLQFQMESANATTNQKFTEINKYIRFVDGKIVLGETGNELMLTIQNDRVSFTQGGSEVAYFSNNSLYINKAEVITTLKVGNYEFVPHSDGGLALRKRSE